MFSKENRQFTVVFIVICLVAMTGIIGAVYLIQHDKQVAMVWSMCSGLVTALLVFARGEMRHREARGDRQAIGEAVLETKDDVKKIEDKTNGNLSRAVHEVAEEVRKAAHEPAPGQEGMPRTPDELQALIRTFVNVRDEALQRVATKAGQKAAVENAAVVVRLVVDELRKQGALILPHESKMEVIPGEAKNQGEGI